MTPPTIYRTVCDPCGYAVSAMSVEALREGLLEHQDKCKWVELRRVCRDEPRA